MAWITIGQIGPGSDLPPECLFRWLGIRNIGRQCAQETADWIGAGCASDDLQHRYCPPNLVRKLGRSRSGARQWPNPPHQLRVHHPVSKRVPAAPSPQVDVGLLLEDFSVLGVRVCCTNREGGADESCSRRASETANGRPRWCHPRGRSSHRDSVIAIEVAACPRQICQADDTNPPMDRTNGYTSGSRYSTVDSLCGA